MLVPTGKPRGHIKPATPPLFRFRVCINGVPTGQFVSSVALEPIYNIVIEVEMD